MIIGTNPGSLMARKSLNSVGSSMMKYAEQLSSGKRINRAGDDAAGTAVSSRFDKQVRGMKSALRNVGDGVSMVQTGEGAMQSVESMLQRMRELAVQAKSGTYSDDDRANLQKEFSELSAQATEVITNTAFNGNALLSGGATFTLQVGADGAETMDIATTDLSALTSLADDISTAAGAGTALTNIDTDLDTLNTARATFGAYQNRLEYTADNLSTSITNTTAAKSRMVDADMAEASSELAKYRVLQQSSIAMIAQSNQSGQNVLSLLQ